MALLNPRPGDAPRGEAITADRHQDHIAEAITRVTGEGGTAILAGVAVVRGPGSHTGLRVGLATAEGLAFARRLPIYPLSSLAVAAHRGRLESGSVLALVAAGRGRVYSQVFRCLPGRRTPEGEVRLIRMESLVGPPAAAAEGELLRQAAGLGVAIAPQRDAVEALMAATREAFESGGGVAYDGLKGEYGELTMELSEQ